MTDTHWLTNVSLFQSLEPDDRARIAALFHEHRLQRGEYLFHEGDPGDHFYIIKAGAFKIVRTAADGREQILDILVDGDVLGEMAMVEVGEVRSASAVALDPTSVLALRKTELIALLHEYPSISLKLLALLSQRLRNANRHLEDLVFLDSRRRVVKTLWQLAQEHGVTETQGQRIALRLTHQDLAGLAGTSRETVTRVLLHLQDHHALTFDRRNILITNPRAVQELLES